MFHEMHEKNPQPCPQLRLPEHAHVGVRDSAGAGGVWAMCSLISIYGQHCAMYGHLSTNSVYYSLSKFMNGFLRNPLCHVWPGMVHHSSSQSMTHRILVWAMCYHSTIYLKDFLIIEHDCRSLSFALKCYWPCMASTVPCMASYLPTQFIKVHHRATQSKTVYDSSWLAASIPGRATTLQRHEAFASLSAMSFFLA